MEDIPAMSNLSYLYTTMSQPRYPIQCFAKSVRSDLRKEDLAAIISIRSNDQVGKTYINHTKLYANPVKQYFY